MKKLILSVALTIASASAFAGSFQVGTVTELAVSHDRATFQLDINQPDGNIDNRSACLDQSKPLNFIIDFNKAGGVALYETVKEAKAAGERLAINGDGACIGDEFEGLDSLVNQGLPPTAE